MDKKDYYEILGVSKTATDEEIKRAFRKLAKTYHPDNKQTGDEAKFKEVGEAYAILSDANKRRQYDQFGHQAFTNKGGANYSGFSAEDIDLGDILHDILVVALVDFQVLEAILEIILKDHEKVKIA